MMDRRRTDSPVFVRQWSEGSNNNGSSSPMGSPAHPRSRLPPVGAMGMSSIKRTQTVAAKAAAQRLAQVMASQSTGDDDEEDDDDDDLGFRFAGGSAGANVFTSSVNKTSVSGNGNSSFPNPSLPKSNRAPSPALGRNFVDHTPPVRSTSAGRPSISVRSATTIVPQSRSSLKTPVAIPPIDPRSIRFRERFLLDVGQIDSKGSGNEQEASSLQDELDMLQEENEVIIDKLRCAEEKREKAEARARELEKQAAALGEGVSSEAKLISRKEAAIRQREAALKAAQQTKDSRDEEVLTLREQIQNLKDETESVMEKLRGTESEAKDLHTMTQRMILTHEEMEEVVLKRCWLARYWGLSVHYGICADIAVLKHEHWSSLAPLPFEVVISAGQKAREETWEEKSDQSKIARDLSDPTGEGNIETVLSVEMGLRELASLKVEDAVVLALAQSRRPNLVRQSDPKSIGDSKYLEAFELSQEESEDVLFKKAWLIYFWRRAKVHGVEADIAEERLKFWINHSGQSPTSHDAVDVERGLIELRKLGIEQQLWEASRREIDQTSISSSSKPSPESEILES